MSNPTNLFLLNLTIFYSSKKHFSKIKTLLLLMLMASSVTLGECTTKTWKYNSDPLDPKNWINGTKPEDCNGIIFFPINTAPIFIKGLLVNEIVLPFHGTIIFTDYGFIDFTSKSNCIRIQELHYHLWHEPLGWQSDDIENPAIPHQERPPCQYDDVVLPKGISSTVETNLYFHPLKVKSLKFGETLFTQEEMQSFLASNVGLKTFFNSIEANENFEIQEFACKDPSGCVCGNGNDFVCIFVLDETIDCVEPVQPVGFCHKICGAFLQFVPKRSYPIEKIRSLLKNYGVDSHVSKVQSGIGEAAVQIVFAEKKFTGKSLDDAADFYQQLLKDESFKGNTLELHSSGPYYEAGMQPKTFWSLIFGTLCGVSVTFVVIFLYYQPPSDKFNFRNRFNIGSRPLSTYKPHLFARYDKRDDTGLIFEDQSLFGSVVSLEKSFDNPMYGKPTPSTSTSYETIVPANDKTERTEIVHVNPLYDLRNNSEADAQLLGKDEETSEE